MMNAQTVSWGLGRKSDFQRPRLKSTYPITMPTIQAMRHETPHWAGRNLRPIVIPSFRRARAKAFSEQQPHPEPWDEEEAPEDVFFVLILVEAGTLQHETHIGRKDRSALEPHLGQTVKASSLMDCHNSNPAFFASVIVRRHVTPPFRFASRIILREPFPPVNPGEETLIDETRAKAFRT
jgi:hypothetical protein